MNLKSMQIWLNSLRIIKVSLCTAAKDPFLFRHFVKEILQRKTIEAYSVKTVSNPTNYMCWLNPKVHTTDSLRSVCEKSNQKVMSGEMEIQN